MGFWSRLVGREKTAPTGRRAAVGQVVKEQPLYVQVQRIGGNLTPAQVSSIFREADIGYTYRLVNLGNEARQKDCHLQGILATRELAIQSLPWQVIPYKANGRKRPTSKDQGVADFLTEALLAIDGDSGDPELQIADFRGLCGHLMGAPFFGHATSETIFQKSGKYVVPVGFSNIGQQRFRFNLDTGRLEWWDQNSPVGDGVDLMAAYPGKFIQYQPRINGDIAVREGLVRPLMWAALFRNWDIRDWMQLAELGWKPWRTGKYQKNATTEDINGLINILEAMTSSGIAVYPETDELHVEWPKNSIAGGQGTHSELAKFMGDEMSKAVLGQTLTTEQGKNGARSLGEVHDKVRGDIKESDAANVASVARRHLLAPLVRMNFGADVAVPGFQFLTEDSVDEAAFSLAIKNLKGAGLPIPTAWVYDRFGIPPPDGAEPCLGMPDGTDAAKEAEAKDPPSPEDDTNVEPNAEGDQQN